MTHSCLDLRFVIVLLAAFVGACKGCGTGAQKKLEPAAADAGAPKRMPFAAEALGSPNDVSLGAPYIERDTMGNPFVSLEVRNVGQEVVTDLELSVMGLAADAGVLFHVHEQPIARRAVHASAKLPLYPGQMRRLELPLQQVPPGGRDALRIGVERVGIEGKAGGASAREAGATP